MSTYTTGYLPNRRDKLNSLGIVGGVGTAILLGFITVTEYIRHNLVDLTVNNDQEVISRYDTNNNQVLESSELSRLLNDYSLEEKK